MLATLVVFCCTALPADTPRALVATPVAESRTPAEAPRIENSNDVRPDAPTPKAMNASANEETGTGVEPIASPALPIANALVRPAVTEAYETPRKRAIWYGLMAAGHAGAVFDAWTTRRAITGGYGVEGDPTQRPFAHSGAIYATTQVSPLLMDYVGHKMMRSRFPLLRQLWWLPQAANASFSWGAAIHNYRVVP